MFGQPRCREWTPLATQQLRLRNLIQIVGYNIRPPDNVGTPCSYYYSLHSTTMSAPFYTSERIQSTHPKWREIDSESIRRMSNGNVVVRLWRRFHPVGRKPRTSSESDASSSHNDVMVQTWGVYFSGLLHVGANIALDFTPESFKSNSLVFQMHGGFFCSYDSLRLERIPAAVSADADPKRSTPAKKAPPSRRIPIKRRVLEKRALVESKSHSPSKGIWRNEDPVSRSQSPPALRPFLREPQHIIEHSPTDSSGSDPPTSTEDLSVDRSEKAENLDSQPCAVPKCRYSQVRFLKSEIRPSYTATKLQKLHLLQYSIKKQKESVAEIKQRIIQKSSIQKSDVPPMMAMTNGDSENSCRLEHDGICDEICSRYDTVRSSMRVNLFALAEKDEEAGDANTRISASKWSGKNGRLPQEDVYKPGDRKFTLSLNKLLEIKWQPSPMQRLEYTRLSKQLEILRFKRKLLSEERDNKLVNIRHLKEIKTKLYEENQDMGSELMQGYHSLSKSADRLKKKKQSNTALEKLYSWSAISLDNRRQKLLGDLNDIYTLGDQHTTSTPSICDIPLAPCSDEDTPQLQDASQTASASGYAAMLTKSAAMLLSKPLRYEIKALGSRSKIVDSFTPALIDRDIPLFTRNRDTSLFRYGLFLLNKNIAQLLWSRGITVMDIRPTLKNLNLLLSPVAFTPRTLRLLGWCHTGSAPVFSTEALSDEMEIIQGQFVAHSLRSLVAVGGDLSIHDCARRFNRFKDCIDGQSPSAAMTTRHRHSRSVGSYNDEQALQEMEVTSSMMGSEPSLLLFDMQLGSDSDKSLSKTWEKSLNTSKETPPADKVKFSIGDDNRDMQPILVKTSSNNGDAGESNPGADGEKAKEDSAVLHDVIVIQSAEAKLDTGQGVCCDTCEEEQTEEKTESVAKD